MNEKNQQKNSITTNCHESFSTHILPLWKQDNKQQEQHALQHHHIDDEHQKQTVSPAYQQ